MVKTAKVIKDHSKDDEVGLNNTVTVYFEDEDFRPINQDWIDNRVRTA